MHTRAALALVASLAICSVASAVTLTIAPDKATYQIGDTIVLDVFGDPEGEEASRVFGRILFGAERASFLASSQQPLTTMFGNATWSQGGTTGGVDSEGRGFADAFFQLGSVNPTPVGNTLIATVTLIAESVGLLELEWQTTGNNTQLEFFSLTNAPGAGALIVPEPSTIALIGLALCIASALLRRSRGR